MDPKPPDSSPDKPAPLPAYVPAGLYTGDIARSMREAAATYQVTVHRTVPVGMTHWLRETLKGAPMRSFFLSELARILQVRGPLWALNACLCKLVDNKEVIKGESRVGARTLKTYRWRLPSDE